MQNILLYTSTYVCMYKGNKVKEIISRRRRQKISFITGKYLYKPTLGENTTNAVRFYNDLIKIHFNYQCYNNNN